MLTLTLLYPAMIALYFGVEPGPLFACYLGLFLLGAACIACVIVKLGADGWDGWIADIFDQLRLIGGWLDVWSTPWRGPR